MFSHARLLFPLTVEKYRDPHLLFVIKGLFRQSFDDALRSRPDPFALRLFFGQELASDPSALRRFQKPPLPFAFQIPLLAADRRNPVHAALSMSLAGSALNHVPTVIAAVRTSLERIATSASARLVAGKCRSLGEDGTHVPLSDDGEGLVVLEETPYRPPGDLVTIALTSPLQITSGGRTLREPAFSEIIRPLMRRVSSLAYYYAGLELSHDFRWLSEISRQVETVEATLTISGNPALGRGVTGEITFAGVAEEFIPFLFMGERFNLGKGAAYGGGSFTINK